MQHARADSARRALPQGELQASVYGNSVAGYVSAVQVVVGETAMGTRKKTGAKFGLCSRSLAAEGGSAANARARVGLLCRRHASARMACVHACRESRTLDSARLRTPGFQAAAHRLMAGREGNAPSTRFLKSTVMQTMYSSTTA